MNDRLIDFDGPGAPPRANGEQPWQRRVFATTMALCHANIITYERFRAVLIATIAANSQPYWSNWQDALEEMLIDAGICDEAELAARASEFDSHPATGT